METRKKILKGKWTGYRSGDMSGANCHCGAEKRVYARADGGGNIKCRSCVAEGEKNYRNSHWAHIACSRCERRARKRGLEFDLTPEYLESIKTDTCPVLGIPLSYGGGSGRSANSASVDRYENSKGYRIGNVHVISDRANVMKNSASWDELRLFAEWVRQQQ